MTHRRSFIAALALLTACGGAPQTPAYPRQLAGYTLQAESVLTGAQIPPYVKPAGLARAVQLSYRAANPIQLTVFETTGSSIAFEALQQWRAVDGKRVSHTGRYFVVAQAERPDPPALDAFLAEFEKQLP